MTTAPAAPTAQPETAAVFAPAAPPQPLGRPQQPARSGRPPSATPGRAPITVGLAVTTVAVLLIGFLAFLLVGSGIAEHRSQDTLYASFRGQLSKAVAPTGPTRDGAAVALLEIPRLHVRNVVVEGTTSGDLAKGPGLRRDTVLPGQRGTSVLLGRRKAYGGPFRSILSLSPGDTITTTTGLGVAHYRVQQIRRASATFQVTPGTVPNQLILVTSDAPLVPTESMLVVATLVGQPVAAPASLPAIGDAERPLHGDGAAAMPLAWWCLALLLVVAAAGVALARWSRAATYLVGSPLVLAILWNVFESLGRLLPNTL